MNATTPQSQPGVYKTPNVVTYQLISSVNANLVSKEMANPDALVSPKYMTQLEN